MKKEKTAKKWILRLLCLVPFLLGAGGYLTVYPGQYLDAIYFAIRLYGMNYDLEITTPVLELSRWIAPFTTLTALFMVVKSLSRRAYTWLVLLQKDIIAVYGDTVPAEYLIEDTKRQRGERKVLAARDFLPARTHVLMLGSDEENLRFFAQNREKFRPGDKVYLQLEDFSLNSLACGAVECYCFSLAELTAQTYWMERAEELCGKIWRGEPVQICLIGNGPFAEQMLQFALIYNIFSTKQSIQYHVFGDWAEYRSLHWDWASISSPGDQVVFHDEPWHQWTRSLSDMDRVILCDDSQQENLHIFHRIQSLLPRCTVDLRMVDSQLFGREMALLPQGTTLFGSYSDLCTCRLIIQEQLIQDAKHQHQAYGEAHPEYRTEWSALDAFTRLSNVCSSIFRTHNLPLVEAALPHLGEEERMEALSELEHIRWCRYHWMHNWSFRPGKKDPIHRTHQDLIPYQALSREAQRKDAEAINSGKTS